MTFLMISALLALSAYLGLRLNTTTSENSALRSQVASLKRQLKDR